MSLNKVLLLGRLGKDPELSYTAGGVAVCKFSLATSKKWKGKDGKENERTEWHNIVVFNKIAELCNQYLKKGRQAFIEGELQTDQFEKDGDKKFFTKIVANSVQFLGDRSESQSNIQPQQGSTLNTASKPEIIDGYTADDIPF